MKKVFELNPAAPGRPVRVLALTVLVSALGGMVQASHAAPGMAGGRPGAMHAEGAGDGGHGGPGGWALGNPRMMDRLLDSINATTEQRTQIKLIATAAQTDLQAQRTQGRALHQQGQALFTQTTVDARAAEALRVQMLTLHDQTSKRRLQMMLDISRVLTPEQRLKLAERMKQRQAMSERHRAEREGLDKPLPK